MDPSSAATNSIAGARTRRWRWSALLCVAFWYVALAQTEGVAVVRTDGTSVTLDAERLMSLPRTAFTASEHDRTHRFEGSDLRDVLAAAGVDVSKELRGQGLRRLVTVHAKDGYVVVFAMAELDASIGDRRVYLVNRTEGAALAAEQGPWRLVVPADRRPARWARQVVRIVVADGP
jgi:hypothetical protein